MAVSMCGPLLSITHSARWCHRRVGDLGTRRLTGAGQLVEDLGGPYNRQVCGFAQPEDLLLHFGEAFVASLHGQVSAGDHDSDKRRPHRVKQDLGQMSEGGCRFDLQDEPKVLGSNSSEVRVYLVDVVLVAQKRHGHHVGVCRRDFEQRKVGVAHGSGSEIRVGQVDTLLRA